LLKLFDVKELHRDQSAGALTNQLLDLLYNADAMVVRKERLSPEDRDDHKESADTTRFIESSFSTVASCVESGDKPDMRTLQGRASKLDAVSEIKHEMLGRPEFNLRWSKRKRRLDAEGDRTWNDGDSVALLAWNADRRRRVKGFIAGKAAPTNRDHAARAGGLRS
jgi:hypothetical protein